jgi:hypothetical protein
MSRDTGPAPISDLLRQTIAQAVESGRTSYKGLERETGVTRASIMRFVRGTQSLHLGMADRLASHFGLALQQKDKGGSTVNYWWVNQGRNFDHERRDGYLWTAARDPEDMPYHWATMRDVRPGDVVFSYFRRHIVAVSEAQSRARLASRPPGPRRRTPDEPDGWRIDLRYRDIQPIDIRLLIHQLLPLMPPPYAPLNCNGQGNRGYLFPVPAAAAQLLLAQIP